MEARKNNRTDLKAFYDLYDLVPRFYGIETIQIGKKQKGITYRDFG